MRSSTFWIICGATCALVAAPAVFADSLLEIMRSCAAQVDDSARLKCYDRGMAQFKEADPVAGGDPSRPSVASSAPVVSSPRGPAPQTATVPGDSNATDRFGLTAGQLVRKGDGSSAASLKRLTAHIVAASPRTGGHLMLRLDNGQMWEQTEDGPDLKIAAGDTVTIDRGLLGAYWLSAHSRRLAIKVRRTQ